MRSEPKGGQTRQNGSQSTLDRCKCSRCSRQTAGGQKIARQRSLAQAWRRVGQGYVAGHAARNPTEPLGALNGCRLMPKLDRAFLSKTKVTFVAAVSFFFSLLFFIEKKSRRPEDATKKPTGTGVVAFLRTGRADAGFHVCMIL